MYDREYNGKTYTLEASGGLINSSLVMQDLETDSYWSIMTGKVIKGQLAGTEIRELSFGSKTQWKDWITKHPETEVLSVNGQEDGKDAYAAYFQSDRGFRNSVAADNRLPTKEPVFTFRFQDQAHAIPLSQIEGGFILNIAGLSLFLYRPPGASMFESTVAFRSLGDGFKRDGDRWLDMHSNTTFDAARKQFADSAKGPARFSGFDTFWYNWSLNNPETAVHVRGGNKKMSGKSQETGS